MGGTDEPAGKEGLAHLVEHLTRRQATQATAEAPQEFRFGPRAALVEHRRDEQPHRLTPVTERNAQVSNP